jgi:site-specific DNA recombinase
VRLHALEPDPVTAPVVARIFAMFLQGLGYLAIAERLTADQVPSPSGHDPDRNPHRHGIGWTKHTVRAILVNPRYTGYQVWNKQRRDEVLLDIDDVAAGYVGRVRWNPKHAWIYSEQPAHEPLVSNDDFDRVQALIGARAWRHKPHKPTPTHRVYLLRKRLRCGICQRRLQGHWVHAQPYYRCSFPPEYQAANELAHPRTVYLREADLLSHLDQWLARLFDPDQLDDTLNALEQASNDHADLAQQLAAVEEAIADAQHQLNQYRAALGAGADPTEVTAWINQATAAKAAAQAERARLRATTPHDSTGLPCAALSPRPAASCQCLTALTAPAARRCTSVWGSRGSTSPQSGSWSSPRTWYANGWCRRVRPQPLAYPRLITTLAL